MTDISETLIERMAVLVRAWANDARTTAEAKQLGTEARAIVAQLPKPIDPDLIEARAIMERFCDPHQFDYAMDRALLDAIKRGRELEKSEGKA